MNHQSNQIRVEPKQHFEYQLNSQSSTNATHRFSVFLSDICNKILALNLKQKDTDNIYKMCLNLLHEFSGLNKKWMLDAESGCDPMNILDLTFDIAKDNLSVMSTQYKRNKMFLVNKQFIQPTEKAIGTRWELKKIKKGSRTIHIPRLLQCTLQHVSILETLRSLFACDKFTSVYFDYNNSLISNQIGRDGSKSYTGFHSGSTFAKCELFRHSPNALVTNISG